MFMLRQLTNICFVLTLRVIMPMDYIAYHGLNAYGCVIGKGHYHPLPMFKALMHALSWVWLPTTCCPCLLVV